MRLRCCGGSVSFLSTILYSVEISLVYVIVVGEVDTGGYIIHTTKTKIEYKTEKL